MLTLRNKKVNKQGNININNNSPSKDIEIYKLLLKLSNDITAIKIDIKYIKIDINNLKGK